MSHGLATPLPTPPAHGPGPASVTRRALVFGASGAMGRALLDCLLGDGWTVDAVSRTARPDGPGLRWHTGGFPELPSLPVRVDAIVSCGPLDHFAHWYASATVECPRVVAFGSTSDATKAEAADAGERALAGRLREAGERLFSTAHQRGAGATLLRPTLIYGAGSDRNLGRIVALARRSGVFVLPGDALGRRQPVHAEDLGRAAFAALDAPAAIGQAFALPGGETLPYREMVARTLAVLTPAPRLLTVPGPLFAIALRAAHATGRLQGLPPGAVARMREDLVFDAGAAHAAFGYAPRPFRPEAAMFPAA
ncbi:NAD-dependent epimerase/dehydratase family protein [Luteimonas sp. WGS1318]|uniref:NAD-dependent epimerase/dehydratase family protein n=1 Tax=Luteimonas sp. WGS1318 TaxID=3366815 RepID=UPI00372D425D